MTQHRKWIGIREFGERDGGGDIGPGETNAWTMSVITTDRVRHLSCHPSVQVKGTTIMKNQNIRSFVWKSTAALALAASLGPATAQGTKFTYQGILSAGGTPANGIYDFKFQVFNDAVTPPGAAQSALIDMTGVGVTNGLFTVVLDPDNPNPLMAPVPDFVFPGDRRWLEISVSTNGANLYAILAPRQELTATPYAITAGRVTGSVADSQLSANIARLNGSATFTGTETFSPAAGPPFAVGNNSKVNNLNADLLDGLDSTAFASFLHNHYGQNWPGAATVGLTLQTSQSGSGVAALKGVQGSGVAGNTTAAGVRGQSDIGYGVVGQVGVLGAAGVYGEGYSVGASGSANSISGAASGVLGTAVSTAGTGVVGVASSASGVTAGVKGIANSPDGVAGLFLNPAVTLNSGSAVRGLASTASFTDLHPGGAFLASGGEFAGTNGVIGAAITNSATNGLSGYGVIGLAPGTNDARGVFGWAPWKGTFPSSNGGPTYGVYGRSDGNGLAYGVYGLATGTNSGTSVGVQGTNASYGYGVAGYSQGTGVYGRGSTGVYGDAGSGNYGVYGSAAYAGVYGTGTTYGLEGIGGMYGVYGSGTSYGLYGSTGNSSANTAGVYGRYTGTDLNSPGTGVEGYSSHGYGIRGVGGNIGVYAQNLSSGTGVYLATQGLAGDFDGDVQVHGNLCTTSGSVGSCSDRRYKDEIQTLHSALATVMKLRGVSFRWRTREFPSQRFNEGAQIGFIAQEVEQVLPQLVLSNREGYLSVDYSHITPVLVEALKEQQQQIETQQASIISLEKRLALQAQRIAEMTAGPQPVSAPWEKRLAALERAVARMDGKPCLVLAVNDEPKGNK
jgi:hypothetical protein